MSRIQEEVNKAKQNSESIAEPQSNIKSSVLAGGQNYTWFSQAAFDSAMEHEKFLNESTEKYIAWKNNGEVGKSPVSLLKIRYGEPKAVFFVRLTDDGHFIPSTYHVDKKGNRVSDLTLVGTKSKTIADISIDTAEQFGVCDQATAMDFCTKMGPGLLDKYNAENTSDGLGQYQNPATAKRRPHGLAR